MRTVRHIYMRTHIVALQELEVTVATSKKRRKSYSSYYMCPHTTTTMRTHIVALQELEVTVATSKERRKSCSS
jgi:hypothetical protein